MLKKQIMFYGLLSAFTYGLIILSLSFLVDYIGVPPNASYLIVYGCAYGLEYTANVKYIFSKQHTNKALFRYIVYLVILYMVNFFYFNALESTTSLSHQSSAMIVIVTLMPVRFLVQKLVIFKNTTPGDLSNYERL